MTSKKDKPVTTNVPKSRTKEVFDRAWVAGVVKETLGKIREEEQWPKMSDVNCCGQGQPSAAYPPPPPRQLSKAAQLGEDLDAYNNRIKDLVGEIKYNEERLAEAKTRLASYRLSHLHALRDFDRQTQQFIGMP